MRLQFNSATVSTTNIVVDELYTVCMLPKHVTRMQIPAGVRFCRCASCFCVDAQLRLESLMPPKRGPPFGSAGADGGSRIRPVLPEVQAPLCRWAGCGGYAVRERAGSENFSEKQSTQSLTSVRGPPRRL